MTRLLSTMHGHSVNSRKAYITGHQLRKGVEAAKSVAKLLASHAGSRVLGQFLSDFVRVKAMSLPGCLL